MSTWKLLPLFCFIAQLVHGQSDTTTRDSSHTLKADFYFNADLYFRYGDNEAASFSSPPYRHSKPGIGWINPKMNFTFRDALLVADVAYGEKQAAFYAFQDTLWHSYVKQLYLEYTFADRLHAAVGAYTTHFDFEYSEPGLNAIYTPSFIYTYIPGTYSGLRLTYDLTDRWSVMTGLYNDQGTNRFQLGKIRNLAGGVYYVSDQKNLAVNFITGEDYQSTDVFSAEVYADAYVSEKVNIGIDAQHYEGRAFGETTRGNWNAVALYGKYELSDTWQFGGRVERFSDPKGFAFGTSDNLLQGYTLTAKYLIPKTHLQLVGEYRYDSSNQLFFDHKEQGSTSHIHQVIASVIYSNWDE